jgi:hypothetical protein
VKLFWLWPVSLGLLLAQDATLPPPGFGSLRQEQIGIRLGDARLSVRVIPLDEHVTRLLAPDAWRSLRDMKASRATEIAAAARQEGQDSLSAFMVTFFALQPDVRFDPDALIITSQNRAFRPVGIVPITPRFSEGTIEQRQQAAAIYLFDPAIDVSRQMTVEYAGRSSDAWSDALRQLNAERVRVLARASQQQGQP